MKRESFITLIVLLLSLLLFSPQLMSLYAQTDNESREPADQNDRTIPQPRQRASYIKKVDFYLRDGQLVCGRLIYDDKSIISVEQIENGQLTVKNYSRRQIDGRTYHTNNVREYQYWLELGDYFTGRIWDFRNDADDFTQALRCYEKALRTAENIPKAEQDRKLIEEKIRQLKSEQTDWEEKMQIRTKLQKLEFEATYVQRLKELEHRVEVNAQALIDALDRIEKALEETEDNYNKLVANLDKMQEDIYRQLRILEDRIENNRKLIDEADDRRYYYFYRYRPRR